MPKSTNPVKVIREKCLDCCCGSMKQVELCPCESNCPLWPFRFGKNPFRKKPKRTEEQMARGCNKKETRRYKRGGDERDGRVKVSILPDCQNQKILAAIEKKYERRETGGDDAFRFAEERNKSMNNDRETKIEEIVRMLRNMDIRALRRVYFFLLGMI